MEQKSQTSRECRICKKTFPESEVVPAVLMRPNIADEIRKEHPDWSADGYICLHDLNHYRGHYIQTLMEKEMGELSEVEQQVIDAMKEQDFIASNSNDEFDSSRSMGERLADKIASFGGSWTFIIIFGSVLFGWIVLNSLFLARKPFDPFPYILLNLMLSCLAAIQAPIIMMSQNRQEARDRLRAENDYQVNLKAELEIRMLSEKVDRLISQQWRRLLEIQQIQTDLMEDLASEKELSENSSTVSK